METTQPSLQVRFPLSNVLLESPLQSLKIPFTLSMQDTNIYWLKRSEMQTYMLCHLMSVSIKCHKMDIIKRFLDSWHRLRSYQISGIWLFGTRTWQSVDGWMEPTWTGSFWKICKKFGSLILPARVDQQWMLQLSCRTWRLPARQENYPKPIDIVTFPQNVWCTSLVSTFISSYKGFPKRKILTSTSFNLKKEARDDPMFLTKTTFHLGSKTAAAIPARNSNQMPKWVHSSLNNYSPWSLR